MVPGSLIVVTPSEEEAAYLPDATSVVHSGLELHSKPVVAMDTKDAKRLQDHFQNAYGNGVRLASEPTTRALVDGTSGRRKTIHFSYPKSCPRLIPVVLSIFAFSRGQSRG